MSRSPLHILTSDKQYPIGDIERHGKRKLVKLKEGPNYDLLQRLRLAEFDTFDWKAIQLIVKQHARDSKYDNLFWDSYYRYRPIERILYSDSYGNYFFKYENEWKIAVRSFELDHLARVDMVTNPTVHKAYGSVYCFLANITAAQR